MGRMRRGWLLTKKSWAVLREHRALVRFPVYAGLATVVVAAVTVLPGIYLIDANDSTVAGIALIAVGIYLCSFVGFYFSVALAATADRIFHGQDARIADGLAVSRQRVGAIAGWAALSTLVGVIFAVLENTTKIGGQIAGYLLSAAWSLITFLAVPVIAIEGTGPVETVKRSAGLFRTRWTSQVAGNVAIGGIIGLLGILPALGLGAAGIALWSSDGNGDGVALGAVLVGLGVVLFAVSAILMRTLSGIFGVALYRFAADGEASGGFTSDELESAVRTRG